MKEKLASLQLLIETIDRLRSPGGCPWDREQTVASLAQFVIEEAYEVVDAIHGGKNEKICEEVGDLMQVLAMICRIAEETKQFSIGEAAKAVSEKLVRRHPHVFGDTKVSGSKEVLQNWEQLKQKEKKDEADKSALSGVPASLPALLRAYRTKEKAARVGFEWKDLQGPIEKIDEEWKELRQEIEAKTKSPERIEAEMGDLLFAIVSLSRNVEVNPEIALRKTVDKFASRFRYVEEKIGKPLKDATLEEMTALWNEAKRIH